MRHDLWVHPNPRWRWPTFDNSRSSLEHFNDIIVFFFYFFIVLTFTWIRRNVIANNKLLLITIITFCFVTLTRSEPLIWTEIPGRGWGRDSDLRSRSGQSRYSKIIIFFLIFKAHQIRSWTISSLSYSYTTYHFTYVYLS